MTRVVRTPDEIGELLNRAYERADQPSKFFGMSYEDGVKNALVWLLYEEEVDPLEG